MWPLPHRQLSSDMVLSLFTLFTATSRTEPVTQAPVLSLMGPVGVLCLLLPCSPLAFWLFLKLLLLRDLSKGLSPPSHFFSRHQVILSSWLLPSFPEKQQGKGSSPWMVGFPPYFHPRPPLTSSHPDWQPPRFPGAKTLHLPVVPNMVVSKNSAILLSCPA